VVVHSIYQFHNPSSITLIFRSSIQYQDFSLFNFNTCYDTARSDDTIDNTINDSYYAYEHAFWSDFLVIFLLIRHDADGTDHDLLSQFDDTHKSTKAFMPNTTIGFPPLFLPSIPCILRIRTFLFFLITMTPSLKG
jgi:hypothetical protein